MWRNLIRDPRRRKSVAWRRRLESVCARGKGTANPGGRASERQSVSLSVYIHTYVRTCVRTRARKKNKIQNAPLALKLGLDVIPGHFRIFADKVSLERPPGPVPVVLYILSPPIPVVPRRARRNASRSPARTNHHRFSRHRNVDAGCRRRRQRRDVRARDSMMLRRAQHFILLPHKNARARAYEDEEVKRMDTNQPIPSATDRSVTRTKDVGVGNSDDDVAWFSETRRTRRFWYTYVQTVWNIWM